jgi:PAS domain S-box-containing protein
MRTNSLDEDVGRLAPTLLCMTDAHGSVQYVNERWTSLLGAPQSALLGTGWTALVHPEDRGQLNTDFGLALEAGQPYRGEFRMRHADGAYRWIEVRSEPERNERGEVVRWFAAGHDIDAQRRAMDALQLLAESGATANSAQDVDALLRGVARAALAGLADIAFFDLIEANGWSRRLGAGGAGVPQAAIDTTLNFPTKFGQSNPISRAMTEVQVLHQARVDEEYIMRAIADPLRRDAWRSVGIRSMIVAPMIVAGRSLGALTMLRTLTDRAFEASDVRVVEEVARRTAVAVENIRLTEAARRESSAREQQFRVVADSMPLLMWTARPDGETEWHNRRWHEYTGQPEGQPPQTGWLTIHPDDLKAARRAWTAALETGGLFEQQHRILRADGTFRWFLTRATPERDTNGAIVRWYGTHTDIDAAHRAQHTLHVFSELGVALATSLEVQTTLDAVMRVVVPEFADWALIDLAGENGELRTVARRHRNAHAAASIEPNAGLVVPLVTGGARRGALTVGLADRHRTFSQEDVDFFEALARRIAPAIANAELFERERLVAHSFQNAALPAQLPDVRACAFSAIYEAGRAEALIGGDWYDAFTLGDGRIVLSIGDVAGSGLRAAVTMANMRQAIRGVAYVHPDPELMLEAADLTLRSESPDRFVTAFVAVIDPIENMLAFATAGHPPPLMRTPGGQIVELEARGLPLGLRDHGAEPSSSCALAPGSLLVLFTDGLIEATHDIDEGYRRLDRALREPAIVAGRDTATLIRDAVLLEGAHDDVAILCARYSGVALQRHRVDVHDPAASARFAVLLVDELERCGYTSEAVINAEIVLAELIGNLVRHTPGTVTFVIDAQPGHVLLHALDDGPGYRFLSRLPSDTFSERGRGLFLIATLAESFHVTPRPFGGSHACVAFSLLNADDGQRTRWSKT